MHSDQIENSAVLLGSSGELFAIRSKPVTSSSTTGVIIFNAGMIHNIGPFRLHVNLANGLGEIGLPVLRLDQSGKGESPLRTGLNGTEAALRDYDDAFEHLESLGVSSTILIGLCSGAADAILIASERPSVSGLVLLDGYAYRTLEATVRIYAGRILSPGSWLRALKRLTEIIFSSRVAEEFSNLADTDEGIDHDDYRRRYLEVLHRNVKMLAVFSGGQNDYNHIGQLAACLNVSKEIGNLHEVYFADSDHTYTLTRHRRRLIDSIVNWTKDNFLPPGAGEDRETIR